MNNKSVKKVNIIKFLVVIAVLVLGIGGYYLSTRPTADIRIELVTGLYLPSDVEVKKGTRVTWVITDQGEIPEYGIENAEGSTEVFSSSQLKTGEEFSHTFKKEGVFRWKDKYQERLGGTVTVTK